MSTDAKQQPEGNIVPLLGEIIEDVQKLVQQEVGLVKAEVREEIDRAKKSLLSFALGVFLGMLALVLFALGGVKLLAQEANLPNWGAYCIMAVVLGGLSYALMNHSQANYTRKF